MTSRSSRILKLALEEQNISQNNTAPLPSPLGQNSKCTNTLPIIESALEEQISQYSPLSLASDLEQNADHRHTLPMIIDERDIPLITDSSLSTKFQNDIIIEEVNQEFTQFHYTNENDEIECSTYALNDNQGTSFSQHEGETSTLALACAFLADSEIAKDTVYSKDSLNVDVSSHSEKELVVPATPEHIQDTNEYDISDESENGLKLVPYSDNSDSDQISDVENEPKVKRRKRCQVDKSTWLYEKNRKRREHGLNYFGRKKNGDAWKKVPKQPRNLTIRCNCNKKSNSIIQCSVISENDRKTIFDAFWKMTWSEKKIYIDSLVKVAPTKRHRDRANPGESKRNCSVIYYLRKQDDLIRVCKTMFLNTLSIGKWSVLKWKSKINEPREHGTPSISEPQTSTKKIPFAKENDALHNFLNSLPMIESHYCRKSTNKNYLLPEWSSKKELYTFYVSDWCRSHNVAPLSVCSFNNALDVKNISLFFPKKDQCHICFSHKLGHISNEDHAAHIKRKEEARIEKQTDKEQEHFVITMDLQAVLLSPRSTVSSLYYKTKLCVHNFCLFDLKTHHGSCYIWNESEGGLNAEEFALMVFKFIMDKVIPRMNPETQNKKIILYSDGCTYQNRNITMSNALLNLAITNTIIIEQKYLEIGHTQMECDSMHAKIEKQLKNRVINVPAEYIQICRQARKTPEPFEVHYLTHDFFKSFDMVSFYKSIRPGRMKGDPKVTDLRALQYQPTGEIFYKLRFGDEWTLIPQRQTRQVSPKGINELPNLYSSRRKITKIKFENLQELKSVIPDDYHHYYDNLPHE